MNLDNRDELVMQMAQGMYNGTGLGGDWDTESGAVRGEALRIAEGFLDVIAPVMDDFAPWLAAIKEWYETVQANRG